MTKHIVATNNENGAQRVDPAVVRAEDLVRAMREGRMFNLAEAIGWDDANRQYFKNYWADAVMYIAQQITLPEDGEVLPFSEPINGWRGEE